MAVPSIDKGGVTCFPARPPPGRGAGAPPKGLSLASAQRGPAFPHPCARHGRAWPSVTKAGGRPSPGGHLAGRSELHNHLLFYTCVTFNANFHTKLPVATDIID